MKISYPREKRNIKLSKDHAGIIYAICGAGLETRWWLQDFWDLPYTFRTYKEAVAGAKKIHRQMLKYKWRDSKAVIMKITF